MASSVVRTRVPQVPQEVGVLATRFLQRVSQDAEANGVQGAARKGFVVAVSNRWPEPEAAYRAW